MNVQKTEAIQLLNPQQLPEPHEVLLGEAASAKQVAGDDWGILIEGRLLGKFYASAAVQGQDAR